MSGARFARSGRARFFICFVALFLMLGMVAIFHNTTRQLDKTREKHLACEQQQETLNEQLQSIIEEKYTLQKNYKNELDEQMQTRQDLEQKVKKLNEQIVKEQFDHRMQYDKLQQAHKLLQSEHKEFIKECTKSKQELLDNANELNRKMKGLHSKELQEQSALSSELAMWQEKYNKIVNEKERLDALVNGVGDAKTRISDLEYIVSDYRVHCEYQPKMALDRLLKKKPLDIPHREPTSSSQTPQLSDASKSFNQQVRLADGRYHINIFKEQQNTNNNNNNKTNNNNLTSTSSSINGFGGPAGVLVSAPPAAVVPETIAVETAPLSFAQRNNGSLILNSVENFQIAPQINKKLAEEKINKMVPPLSAPHKLTSTTAASKVEKKMEQQMANLQMATNKTSRADKLTVSSSSNMPPLQLPPKVQQSQKLPDNVAPIPEHFEDLLKIEEQQQSNKETNTHDNRNVVETQGDAAVAETQNSETQKKIIQLSNDDNNNRYANVVKDMDGSIANKNIKENEAYMNEQNFNLPNNEDENNFFDTADDNTKNAAGSDVVAAGAGVINKADGNDANETAEDIVADVGDIEVKQNKNSLNDDNVNNEVAGDQGKEFDEGMEEGADEDDYSHGARQQGEEVIRN